MIRMLSVAVAMLLVATTAGSADDQVRDLLFRDALQARAAADEVNAKTYSPRNYEHGSDAFADATRDLDQNRPLDRVRAGLAEAQQSFNSAAETAVAAQQELAALIKLRDAANSVNAGLHDTSTWQAAERKFRDAILEFERGDQRLAQRRASEAEEPYRQAELTAIKAAYLNDARRLIEQAGKARADRYAPRTLSLARNLLAEAEKELSENRYDTDRPRDLARQAQYEARHALYLAGVISEATRDQRDPEALILAGEEPLRQIAAAADLNARFDQGYAPTTQLLIEHIRDLQTSNRQLEQDLYERVAQVDVLERQLSSLEQQLGGVSEQRKELEIQLARQARERERFARIESMFTADQAEVLRSGGNVIIRVVGTSFPVGKATIEPSAFSLLSTLMNAIRVFPDAQIAIEGHTDSYGSDATNMALSQQRADAVRAYLMANMNIDTSRLSATGYGETRPIANNETREGRARNRRIDVVIRPPR